jgi:hypothetical protein
MQGLGVMINMLCGWQTGEEIEAILQKCIGNQIYKVDLVSDMLRFEMVDGYKFSISDEGQSCCEHRYMTTDDVLDQYVGATLLGFEIRPAPDVYNNYGCHEVQFLVISTSLGNITAETHNEHNGYYGGFSIILREG